MARYAAVGNWHTEESSRGGIVVKVCDALDKRTGHTYRDGCYLVSGPNIRTKRWYGETAWMDAQRYAKDAMWAARRNA